MAIYHDLDNTGQEVQNRLDQVPVTQADLAQEVLDRQTAVGAVQDNVDAEELRAKAAEKANADNIDSIEEKIPSGASSSNKLATVGDVSDEATARENADATLQQAIEAILLLIPSAATSLNKLADKNFVNSSVATATATFRGTKNLVSDLELAVDATHEQIAEALATSVTTADNNDYAFVQVPTSAETPAEIRVTERYKFDGTAWSYEYDLNNSGFTADQWAAINSGITEALVTKLSALPNNADLTAALGVLTNGIASINEKIPAAASSSNKLVDTAAMQSYITQILGAIDATFNITSTDGHVTIQITQTDGVITALAVTTNDIASAADVAQLFELYNALQQSDPEIIQPTDTWPVANPSTTDIYRVIDRVNTPPQNYSDYMFSAADLTTPILMATYNNAIDQRPKKGSTNLVSSGGVFDNMGALDVSELNATENPHTPAIYADLDAALAAIPSDYQKGGMSIKFIKGTVHSVDNKYVQFRYMSSSTADADFTNTDNWQGVDKELTVNSKNLAESGGVVKKIQNIIWSNGYILYTRGTVQPSQAYKCSNFISVLPNTDYHVNVVIGDNAGIAFYDANKKYLSGINSISNNQLTTPDGAYYVRLSTSGSIEDKYFYNDNLLLGYASKGDAKSLDLSQKRSLFNYNWSNGYINYSTGEFVSSSAWRATDYIAIVPGDYYCNSNIEGGIAGYAYYNEKKKYLGGSNRISNNTITFPENAYYVRISYDLPKEPLLFEFYRIDGKNSLQFATKADYDNNLSSTLIWLHGYILKTTGAMYAAETWRCTDYTPIIPNTQYFCNPAGLDGGNAGIAFYDENKIFLSGISTITNNIITTPDGAYYIRISNLGNDTAAEKVSLRPIDANAVSLFPSRAEVLSSSNLTIKNNNIDELTKLPDEAFLLDSEGNASNKDTHYGSSNYVLGIPVFYRKPRTSVIRFKVRFNEDFNKKSSLIDYTQENPTLLTFFSMVYGNYKLEIGVLPDYPKNPDDLSGYETYGNVVGMQGTTQIKAVNEANQIDGTPMTFDNFKFKWLAGDIMFSIQWANANAENADVCMSNDGTTLRFYHSTNNATISSYTLANYNTLTELYDALSEDTNLVLKIFGIAKLTTSNLMKFSDIKLCSQRTVVDGVNAVTVTYPTKTVYDNPPIYLRNCIDNSWHTVEIAADSTINSGVYCVCVDGYYMYADGRRISNFVKPVLYFGGTSNGTHIDVSIKDIEVKYNNQEDTEIVSYVPSTRAQIISNWHPKVYALEGHTMVDDTPDDDYGSIPSMHTYDRMCVLFDKLVNQGYVPLTLTEFDRYIKTGKLNYKRAFIAIYDDYQYDIYLNHRFNSLHKKYGVMPNLAEITYAGTEKRDKYTYNGVVYNVSDINDWMERDGWLPMTHARHEDYPRFGYEDLKVALQNSIGDAIEYHIPLRGFVYPGGSSNIMDEEEIRNYGWGYAFEVYRSIALASFYSSIKRCDNDMSLPRLAIPNSVSLGEVLKEIL